MDATKILEEMDQFKELWNQVAIACGLHSNAFFLHRHKMEIENNDASQITSQSKGNHKSNKKQQNETNQSNLEVKTCQWC